MVKNASEYILSYNRTFRKQLPKCQTSLVAYESLDHIGLLEYGNCIDLSHASMPIMQCFTYLKVSFKKKKAVFPTEKFPSLVLPRNHLLLKLRSIVRRVVAYGRLKTKENIKLIALKSGRGRLGEVIAYMRFQI